ncbi:hypothetical protein CEUSTIGMA_g11886.t1 [Chlamydomonas eustigma]|uniref:Uncharacterized protein n=1 Tax=Chlamydomonas eustigma TaxID=1157962 RepID=A0A250XN75_9CHLO|nr:hypothetical protein CEUSTIGMA_g11886.t1 [Chlamydomonas eustigma]|eukprot:GAX84466.1 hypothetical protein CEUSTIGMA_g11886.t1 [Chlamydomonas eustigma]
MEVYQNPEFERKLDESGEVFAIDTLYRSVKPQKALPAMQHSSSGRFQTEKATAKSNDKLPRIGAATALEAEKKVSPVKMEEEGPSNTVPNGHLASSGKPHPPFTSHGSLGGGPLIAMNSVWPSGGRVVSPQRAWMTVGGHYRDHGGGFELEAPTASRIIAKLKLLEDYIRSGSTGSYSASGIASNGTADDLIKRITEMEERLADRDLSQARLEQKLHKTELAVKAASASSNLEAKINDIAEKVKRIKASVAKIDTQISAGEARASQLQSAIDQATKSSSARMTALEGKMEAVKTGADKAVMDLGAALGSKLESTRSTLDARLSENAVQTLKMISQSSEKDREETRLALAQIERETARVEARLQEGSQAQTASLTLVSDAIGGQQQRILDLEKQVEMLNGAVAAAGKEAEEKMQGTLAVMLTRMQALEEAAKEKGLENTASAATFMPAAAAAEEEGSSTLAGTVAALQAQMLDINGRLLLQKVAIISAEDSASDNRSSAIQQAEQLATSVGYLAHKLEEMSQRLAAVEDKGVTYKEVVVSCRDSAQAATAATAATTATATEGEDVAQAPVAPPSLSIADSATLLSLQETLELIHARVIALESATTQKTAHLADSAGEGRGSIHTLSEATGVLQQVLERIQVIENRLSVSSPAEVGHGADSATSVTPISLEVLEHITNRIKALEEGTAASSPTSYAAEGAAPSAATAATEGAAELSLRVDSLADELHDRVTELQEKMSNLLQLIVQRVKSLEVMVNGPASASRAATPLELKPPPGSVEVVQNPEVTSLQQQLEAVQSRLVAIESDSIKVPLELKIVSETSPEQVPTQQSRLEEDVASLTVQLHELQERFKTELAAVYASAAAAAAAAAAVLPGTAVADMTYQPLAGNAEGSVHVAMVEQRLNEIREEGVSKLQDIHEKVTPVLQLLVQRVKDLETAGSTSSSAPGAGSVEVATVPLVDTAVIEKRMETMQKESSELSGRISAVEDSLTQKLNAMQGKVTNVMQLLVQRVKALESAAGVPR